MERSRAALRRHRQRSRARHRPTNRAKDPFLNPERGWQHWACVLPESKGSQAPGRQAFQGPKSMSYKARGMLLTRYNEFHPANHE